VTSWPHGDCDCPVVNSAYRAAASTWEPFRRERRRRGLAHVHGVTPESLSVSRLLQRRAVTAARCVRSSVTMCSPVRSLAVVIASTCRENAEGIVRSRSSPAKTRESGPRSLAAIARLISPGRGRGVRDGDRRRPHRRRPPYLPPAWRHVTSQHCTSRRRGRLKLLKGHRHAAQKTARRSRASNRPPWRGEL